MFLLFAVHGLRNIHLQHLVSDFRRLLISTPYDKIEEIKLRTSLVLVVPVMERSFHICYILHIAVFCHHSALYFSLVPDNQTTFKRLKYNLTHTHLCHLYNSFKCSKNLLLFQILTHMHPRRLSC